MTCKALFLGSNRAIFYQIVLAKMLLDEGQKHLFDHWPEPGVDDTRKKSFLHQVSIFFMYSFGLLDTDKSGFFRLYLIQQIFEVLIFEDT